MKKLSVIICVYNTNPIFLHECLQSIFNSTLSDIETIIIDDGSTLDYSAILKQFDVKYIKTENQGTLSARLLGIQNASGEYVCFVDADDIVSFDFFEASYIQAKQTSADIAINDWAFYTPKCKYVCTNDSTINSDLNLHNNEIIKAFFNQKGLEHSYYVLWNKIYKRELIFQVSKIIQDMQLSKLVFGEDVLLNFYLFKIAKRLVNTHCGHYFYRIHENQEIFITNANKVKYQAEMMTKIFNIIENDFNFDKEMSEAFLAWKNLLCFVEVKNAKHSNDKNLANYILKLYNFTNVPKVKNIDHCYSKQKLLPQNINQLDTLLKEIFISNKALTIYAKGYSKVKLEKFIKIFKKNIKISRKKQKCDYILPKDKQNFLQSILHFHLVYKIGIALFPKGSKIRKLLKSKL